MEERGQFTFYRSFWDAIKGLPKKDRLPILESIISYALDGNEPRNLSQSQSAFFLLVKPTLDSSRKKAANGKQGGSKPKANRKQTQREKEGEIEKEKENEKEIEIENECYISLRTEGANTGDGIGAPPFDGRLFTDFWKLYPAGKGGDREEAWKVWKEIAPSPLVAGDILQGLQAWIDSEQWQEDGGRYIPGAAKFLRESRWKSPPHIANQHEAECAFPETLAYARELMARREGG